MQFPQSFNGREVSPQTPLIGQQQVPMCNFQIQVTPELMQILTDHARMTGLDGPSLMNFVFTRGLVAIKQDYLNAQEPAEEPDPETEGTPQE